MPEIDVVHIACSRKNRIRITALIKKLKIKKVRRIVSGGTTRFATVKKLMNSPEIKKMSHVIILNGANPLMTPDEIRGCLTVCRDTITGVAVGRRASASLKKVRQISNSEKMPKINEIITSLDRGTVWEMETPQVVQTSEFLQALACVRQSDERLFTDDLAILEAAHKKTAVIPAHPYNRKITYPLDVALLNGLITSIGIGEDSHAFIKSKKPLMLGGLCIASEYAFRADSDGDVILHALANALSSALGGGSLGTFATALCKIGIQDSAEYVLHVIQKMHIRKYSIVHLSILVEGLYPKIDPLAVVMRKKLSELLEISPERIGITATTGKAHTAYGKGTAVRAAVSILLTTNGYSV